MLARPSGNEIVFCTSARGPSTATGPTMAANTATAVPVRIHAARLPSLTRTRTTATTRAGQAVAYKREHRHVSAAHGQREGDHRRRGHQHGPAHHVTGADYGQRRGEDD